MSMANIKADKTIITKTTETFFLHTRQFFRHFYWHKKFLPYTKGYKMTLIMCLNTRAPVFKDIGQRQDKLCWYHFARC